MTAGKERWLRAKAAHLAQLAASNIDAMWLEEEYSAIRLVGQELNESKLVVLTVAVSLRRAINGSVAERLADTEAWLRSSSRRRFMRAARIAELHA